LPSLKQIPAEEPQTPKRPNHCFPENSPTEHSQ
jgi:hypothetical protein